MEKKERKVGQARHDVPFLGYLFPLLSVGTEIVCSVFFLFFLLGGLWEEGEKVAPL